MMRPINSGYSSLNLGDPAMARNVDRARKLLNRNIPLLLYGETGTGKGMFAKAFHDASERSSKPFVAVNCASIPEALIESELFGYRARSIYRRQSTRQSGKNFAGGRRYAVFG